MRSPNMKKPTIKSVMRGAEGNKFRAYEVKFDGRTYNHGENRAAAKQQYNAAVRVYQKLQKIKKK